MSDAKVVPIDLIPVDLIPVRLLRRDLAEMAKGLGPHEIRFLVDYYYQQQENRKGAANQMRSAQEHGEAHAMVRWLADLELGLENQIKTVLDEWTMRHDPIGISRWARSNVGIGPVIAAGLAAHIDIEKTQSISKLWRFAGQDPTHQWHGTAAGRDLVRAAFEVEGEPGAAVWWLAEATHRHPTRLWAELDVDLPTRDSAIQVVADLAGVSTNEVRDDLFAQRPLEVDNAINFACEELGIEARDVYTTLYAGQKLDRNKLVALLARRPWNARLKVLCWKAGESFVKFSNHPGCFYGHIYAARKAEEIERNLRGEFAEQAREVLDRKRIGEDTEARKAYQEGRLPAAHIHARAKRYTVKVFLSHYWLVLYQLTHGQPAPRPWILQHGGPEHEHEIPIPNWPMAA